MSWIWLGLVNIVFLSLYNYLTKLVSKDLLASVRLTVFFCVGLVIAAVWLAYDVFIRKQAVTMPSNLVLIILMSISFVIGMSALQEMLIRGAPLSSGILFVRIGNILLAMIIGVLILKEGLSLQLILGALLSISGLVILFLK